VHFHPRGDRKCDTIEGMKAAIFIRSLSETEQQQVQAGLRSKDAFVLPLPNLAGQCPGRTSNQHCPPTGLRRPNGSQCDPWLQCLRFGRAARRLLALPSPAQQLFGGRTSTAQGFAASPSLRVWQRAQHLDAATGRSSQFRTGHRCDSHLAGERALSAQTAQNQLETSQTLDYEPRSAVPAQKKARDRLIAWCSLHSNWAIGFLDEVWWGCFALPPMHAWQDCEHPVRLVEQSWQKDDPDPKALACYAVLWQEGTVQEPVRDHMWLRFVTGRPVSAITTQSLDCCCERLAAGGKRNWLLIWGNASWHVSKHVRTWIREHNQQVREDGKGVRILPLERLLI
jgi:hypothetical protein